jgi:hypothetical protein
MAADDVDVIVAKEIAPMKYLPVAALASLLLAAPAFAQTTAPTHAAKAPAAKTAAPKPAATPATHATRGVVKTVDASSLVITRGKAGANVSVRYHTEGKDKVATAVSVQQPKQPAAAKSKTSK